MIDQAEYAMAGGSEIALARAQGVDDNMVKSHYHQYFELYYLEAGSRFHVAADRLHLLEAPGAIIFPPYVMHHSYSAPGVRFKRVVVYFKPAALVYPRLHERIGGQVRSFRPAGKSCRMIDGLLERLFVTQGGHDEYRGEELQLLLNELLIRIVREEPANTLVNRRQRMSEVIRYLHEHHAEPISLEELSSQFFISPYYLCREFKKHTNATIVQYLNNVRIGRAQRLLNESDLSVTEISKRVGFANVTHFNRVFKQITGMSPSASKKRVAGPRLGVTG